MSKHPAVEHVLKFFKYDHLPPNMQEASKPFCDLAQQVAERRPESPETTVALRKLLEAKDAAVRALLTLVVLVVFLSSRLFAADLSIAGDSAVPSGQLVTLKAVGVPEDGSVVWRVHPRSISQAKTTNYEPTLLEFTALPGTYEVTLTSYRLDGKKLVVQEVFKTVVLGSPQPGPTPPGPTPPGPTPPGPTPTPDVVPIVEPGFRVLIVYDEAKKKDMPVEQFSILGSQEVADYLNAKTVDGPATKEWRVYPSTQDVSRESKIWQEAMKRPRTSLPWIIISDGSKGYEGPLPKNIQETLTLLRKYGG